MPNSMNFANDPNYGQSNMPMWDPNQYPGQDPYQQGMYPDAQAAYSNQMAQQGFQNFDPLTGQPIYNDQFNQAGMYYNDAQAAAFEAGEAAEEARIARQAQMRASSIFGPKDHAAQIPEIEINNMQSLPPQPQMVPQQQVQQAPQQNVPQMQPTQPQQPVQSQPAQAPQAQAAMSAQNTAAHQAINPPSKGQAVWSLILGILSIIFAVLPPIGMILGWISTRLSKKYRKSGGRANSAYSGKIFGRVGFAFSFIMLIILGGCFLYVAGATFGNYGARAMGIYWNNSPLGRLLFMFPFD